VTPGKFCTRWWQAQRTRSDAPYQRWARDMAFRFHCPLRSLGLIRKQKFFNHETHKTHENRSWYGKLDQSLDRQRVGKVTPGKFCTRWWEARRARSDAPYQRWARDMAFRFHGPLRSLGLIRKQKFFNHETHKTHENGSWYGKLDQSLDRQRVGKVTPGKFCTRWWQAQRTRSDAPYQRWARDMAFRFHCPLRSLGLIRKQKFFNHETHKTHENRSGMGPGNEIAPSSRGGTGGRFVVRRASGPTRRAGRPCHPFRFGFRV